MKFSSLKFLTVFLLLFTTQGCGGGSKGTGGDQLLGKVLNPQQAPLAGVTVTDLNSGETAVTQDDGSFLIATELNSGTVAIGLDTGRISTTVLVINVTDAAITLRVIIQLDENNATATPIEVEITEATKTPTPRPTRIPTGVGSGTRTPTPTALPGATLTPPIPLTPTQTPVNGMRTPTPTPTEADDDDDDDQEFEDTGVVSTVNADAITVNSVTYAVTVRTEVKGNGADTINDIKVGDTVRIRANRVNGTLEADEIELRSDNDD